MTVFILMTVGILCIGSIAFCVYYFQPKTTILRRLKKLPHQRIGSLRTNIYSKIEGVAVNIEAPLIAPLSKRKCVFYKILIQKKVSSGKSSRWKTLVDKEHIQDFFIEQTGERLVVLPTKVPKNYYDYLVTDKTTNSGTFNNPTPEFKSLLKFYNIASEGLFGFNNTLIRKLL
jgi:hypothetical protein